jgi:hypothetical protein
MNSRVGFLKDGPLLLLSQLASLYPSDGGADLRAQVTLHARGGRSWTGIPAEIVNDKKGHFFVILEIHPKKNTVALDLQDIQAVEFESLDTIYSFLEKPWMRDGKFRSVTKLQFQREMEPLWASLSPLKVKVEIEKFPADSETPGTLLAWMTMLKSEVEKLAQDPLGKKAIQSIETFMVTSGTQPLSLVKEGKCMTWAVSLSKESFNPKQIAETLNALL